MSGVQAVTLLSSARRMARQRRQRTARWAGGMCIYAAALAGLWVAAHMMWSGVDRTLALDVAATRQRIAQAEQTLGELKPQLTEVQTTLAASHAVGHQPDWSLLLTLLADLLDERTVLRSCKLEPKGNATRRPGAEDVLQRTDAQRAAHGPYDLHMEGYAQSQSAVSAYVLRLEATGLFQRVTLVDTRMEPFHDGRAVSFRIECQLGRQPGRVADMAPQ